MQTSRITAGALVAIVVGVLVAVFIADGSGSESAQPAAEQSQAAGEQSQPAAEQSSTTVAEPEPIAIEEPENLGPRPEFVGITGWMNTDLEDPETIFDDRVTVVQLWTFGCYNCKNTLPHLRQLYADNADRGLEIIGVHSPEFDYEADEDNIANALVDLDITWPVALDPNKETFRKWQEGGRRAWPRVFVIDQNGDIRYDHTGEGRYDELTATVDYLLENPPA